MEIFKKNKKDIFIGVIASIITAAILKFVDWILDIAPSAGHSIMAGLTNIIYSIAATQGDNFILTIFLSAFLGVFIGTSIPTIKSGIFVFRKTLQIKKIEQSQNVEKSEKIFTKGTSGKDTDTKEADIKKIIRDGKKVGIITVFFAVFILAVYLFANVFILRPVNIRDKFDRDIIMIYPYVEESAIYKLKSEWVRMRSKDDYDKIYDYIHRIKLEYSLLD